ncbi:Pr6Pr family membrane protein [Microbacterium sp. 3J1]|uniref:Pr6Pr family membrane protein n=1 Tax=Microbacterium sp. 3J1 TaxID=861269 RepID=UPI000AA930FF|nr:Pr6Pr family membrane protein [Microbacterium sp. 3J1]
MPENVVTLTPGSAPTDDRRHVPPLQHAAVNSRPIALAYRIVAAGVILTGVLRNAEVFSGTPAWSSLLFYTMISDLICLVWMLLLVVRTGQDLRRIGRWGTSTPSARWSGAVMMSITVTMLIYLVVLVPTRFAAGDSDVFSLTDNLIHIVTPTLLIVDWLLFVPKGSFRWVDPLLWPLIPYAYLLWAFVYGAGGGEFTPGQRYPYPFMDVDALGVLGVAQWVVALTIALVVVGFVYVVIDRALASAAERALRVS